MTSTLASPDVSRRDRKKRATRMDLSLAALNLVIEKGVANVTVEDIAERADVSTRTFFNYFPSKEAAIIGYNPERAERLRATLLSRPADETPFMALRAAMLDQVTAIVEEAAEFGEGRADWLCRMHVVKSDPNLYAAFVANNSRTEKECTEALCLRMGVDPEKDLFPSLLVGTMIVAARVAIMCWVASGGLTSALDLTAASIDALGAGLRNSPIPELTLPNGSLNRTKQMMTNFSKSKRVS